MTHYHWGIIGLGDIAHQFAADFKSEKSEIYGVAARRLPKVQAFAEEFSIPTVYETVEDLLADDVIDFVYIAVPNNVHHQYIMAALQAGKHVLCEKAITMNSAELTEEIALAKEKNLVLQEAMTIFNMPLYLELKKIADSGTLGKLKLIQAPFGSYKEPDPTNRFFNPELAGGALLDIGTYAVSFARFFLSATPDVLFSNVLPFETGVDEQSITVLRNQKDEMATVSLSFQAKMPKQGIVAYENAYITVDEYPRADKAEIVYRDGHKEIIEAGNTAEALNYEVQTLIETVEGAENRTLPLTIDVIRILDDMRRFW
ncbi:Gfo/Idh/MocA family protein [Enterococcus saccharolyticus]|uniref:Oxidoreductase NAD-binding Rossmann fold protein n=1 Tax=Enterococcus saccharolyticus subsp. saccharolyticus ATCC 43076 TaxID=1139996 RepID=S0JME9_9ENTE|nr:Gfo/Idh/MocA family oxidoreductase [Enterococcus saccharolyticus]EOT29705.1 oxidoreductase NAD-binding Rossmann fold protein [Enterococcus saccharolyticus subsp. saccharolyticus ATCC 43076]EOT80865.1 oxidoreductase NAD-binding Rossmann fold protein [Enterococcus saccharolyticus subsp. saccharolyticus ATCC 43076]OJG89675.1 oxidoreductase NAD-binding Rossmann fold protein [Enterococcus saccharolyticus]